MSLESARWALSGANWFFAAVREVADRDPAAPWLEASDRRWTYADMVRLSGRMAQALVASGVEPGDRVAVQVDKSPEALLVYLAAVRAGAVYLPLNNAYTAAEVDYFVGDAEPRLLVCSPQAEAELRSVAETHSAKLLTLAASGEGTLADAFEATVDEEFEDVPRGEHDLAAMLYTSGTTGRSKGAMLTHGNLLSNALALKDAWRFTADDRLIHALPLFHAHGLFVATNTVVVAGASMICLPKFDAAAVLSLMDRATVFMGVPTFYVRLAQEPGLTREATAGMRLFVSGSAPLLAETHRSFEAKTGHAILERYGMTETVMNTSNPYDGERVAGSVGLPLSGVEVRIVDPKTRTELATGEIGAIEVRGPNVFKGYWRMPEKTKAELLEDGFFVTGDVGRCDERGYIFIVGRDKDLVITGGYNVYPREVETAIDAIPGVGESAVIGVPHPDFGEGVTAVVVRDGSAEVDEPDVLASLQGRLAKFKQPKRVLFLDELPRNAMGKVEKRRLRERFVSLYGEKPAS